MDEPYDSCKKTGDKFQAKKKELNEDKNESYENQGSQTPISEKQMTADKCPEEVAHIEFLRRIHHRRIKHAASAPSDQSYAVPWLSTAQIPSLKLLRESEHEEINVLGDKYHSSSSYPTPLSPSIGIPPPCQHYFDEKYSLNHSSTIDLPDQPPPGTVTEIETTKKLSFAADDKSRVNQEKTRETETIAISGPSNLQISTMNDDTRWACHGVDRGGYSGLQMSPYNFPTSPYYDPPYINRTLSVAQDLNSTQLNSLAQFEHNNAILQCQQAPGSTADKLINVNRPFKSQHEGSDRRHAVPVPLSIQRQSQKVLKASEQEGIVFLGDKYSSSSFAAAYQTNPSLMPHSRGWSKHEGSDGRCSLKRLSASKPEEMEVLKYTYSSSPAYTSPLIPPLRFPPPPPFPSSYRHIPKKASSPFLWDNLNPPPSPPYHRPQIKDYSSSQSERQLASYSVADNWMNVNPPFKSQYEGSDRRYVPPPYHHPQINLYSSSQFEHNRKQHEGSDQRYAVPVSLQRQLALDLTAERRYREWLRASEQEESKPEVNIPEFVVDENSSSSALAYPLRYSSIGFAPLCLLPFDNTDSFKNSSNIDFPDQPLPGKVTEIGMTKKLSADATSCVTQENIRETEPPEIAGPSAISEPTCSQSIVVGPLCQQVRPAVLQDSTVFNVSGAQDAFEQFSVQSDTDAMMEMEASVTAMNYPVTYTLPTQCHRQSFSSDSDSSGRNSSCLPRSHSSPSLTIPSAQNQTFTRANSLPDMLLKTSLEEFTPDITLNVYDETYMFQCFYPGLYQCSVTGLVFHMEGEGDVVYRVVPWDRRQLAQHHKQPAGPLFDIECQQESVCQLHLPHCEIRSTGGCDFLSVAHVNHEGIEFISPHKITETHVVINISGFSAFGNIKDEDSPPDPVRALVLLFYKPPEDPDPESNLNVLLLPRNVVLQDVLLTKQQLDKDERYLYIHTTPHCELLPNQEYILSTCPEDDLVQIQPTKAKFDSENYNNYFPSFEVSLEKVMKHIKLFLRHTDSSKSVWERKVCLSSTGGKRSCGQSALNLSPEKKLFEIRSSFIDRVSIPVLKSLLDKLLGEKVIHRSEMESVEKKDTRGDKASFVIDTVRNKGGAASEKMIKFLCELDPFLCEHLGLI